VASAYCFGTLLRTVLRCAACCRHLPACQQSGRRAEVVGKVWHNILVNRAQQASGRAGQVGIHIDRLHAPQGRGASFWR
jgi:hypothetical protein